MEAKNLNSIEFKLQIAIDALKTIRQNRRRPNDWEKAVIDKALKIIKDPGQFKWDHLRVGFSCNNCKHFDDEWFRCNNSQSLFYGDFENCEYNKKLSKECYCNKFEPK